MTTLPQTTTVRVPRTAGPSQLMMPGPGYPVAQAALPTGQMTGADVWRVIRANVWLILGAVVVFAVLGVVMNFWLAKFHARYTATGLIQVQPNEIIDPIMNRPERADRPQVEIEQRSQAALLQGERLYSDVLQRSEAVKQTSWYKEFADSRDAKENLMKRLSITPKPDTNLIMIQFSASVPKDCKTVVEEIVQGHLDQQGQMRRDTQLARSQTLNKLKEIHTVRRNDLLDQLRTKGNKLAIDALGVPGHLNATEQRAGQLMSELAKLEGEAEAAKATFESLTAQLNSGQEPPILEEMMARDTLVVSYRQQVDAIDVALFEYQKLGDDHPFLKQLNARREISMKKYIDTRAEQLGKYRAALLDRMKTEMTMTQLSVATLNKSLEAVKNDLVALTEDLNIYLSTMEEEKSMRETLKSIDKELQDIKAYNLRADNAGVFWAQKPDVPDKLSFPRMGVTLSVAILLGLALSLGLSFLREMLDTSVRSPRDIARVGQMNILGMVPDERDDPAVAGVRLPLAIFEAPNSAFAEQLRQMRTRLQHTVSLDTTRAILVTSAGPEDGKTTIVCNLAAGLALNGRRILLVDANFRRPQIHNVFGMANDKGFSDALNAPDNFAAFVKQTPIPNLAILACGAKPGNATEMLESQLLIDFIDRALDEYDHVIFDSGPMLFVSETVAMAPRVDGVVTVVRAQQNSRGALQRMRDGLRQIKAQHIGVVLNAVRAQGGGYYAQNIRTHYEYQGLPSKQV